MQYVNMRDAALRLAPEDILKDDPLLADRRERLTEWLIEIAHYFKCSQDTLYHSINLLDRALAIKTFRREVLQLVGITCFLIATKVVHYHDRMYILKRFLSFPARRILPSRSGETVLSHGQLLHDLRAACHGNAHIAHLGLQSLWN